MKESVYCLIPACLLLFSCVKIAPDVSLQTTTPRDIYYYVLDETPVGPYLMPEEYSTYTYSSPEITGIKINWGWWSQWSYPPKNNGWYALTGGWTVEKDDLRYDYNYNLSMIYGFAVAE